jgi:heavy metal efflux system protein
MLKKTAFAPGKTNITYGTDQNNIAENGHPLNVFGVEQSFSFPTLYSAENKTKQIEIAVAETNLKILKNEVIQNVSGAFFYYQLLLNKRKINITLDSLYSELLVSTEKRAEKGDVSHLEALNIKAKKNQVSILLNSLNTDIGSALEKLKLIMNYEPKFMVSENIELLNSANFVPDSLPVFQLLKLENDYYSSLIRVSKNKTLPDFSVNYFLGSNKFENSKYYHGFQVGVAVPLFFGSDKGRTQAARISENSQILISENEAKLVTNRLNELTNEQLKYRALIDNYNSSGKNLYDEIMRTALKSYKAGEIDFYRFVNSYETAVQIQLEYIENCFNYNVSTSRINYFSK